jgi:polar amino acid transport system substrate-binding protein
VKVIEVDKIEDAYDALQKGGVDAVVFDSPVLLYYAGHEGQGKVQVAGPVFHKENYGIVLPAGSPLRKPINEALLTVRENGVYQKLYDEWFGGSSGSGS